MIAIALPDQDTTELEKLLIKDGLIVPVSYQILKEFPQEMIMLFCHKFAVYQIPTTELIGFLQNEIVGTAIEIGAGNGVIGRTLNIKMYDNMMQTFPNVKGKYTLANAPTINYGKDVIQLSGNDAVRRYKPDTVIACWLTQKFHDGRSNHANLYGVREPELFHYGLKKYIHVGNERTHANKAMFQARPCRRYQFPWIVSRSPYKQDNVIYLFT